MFFFMTSMVSIDTVTIRKRCLVWCKSHVEAVVSADIAAPSRTGLMATPRLSPDPCAAERSDERVVQAQTTARGYFTRAVRAVHGDRLRLVDPSTGETSPTLVVV